jgi:hypothetical protein
MFGGKLPDDIIYAYFAKQHITQPIFVRIRQRHPFYRHGAVYFADCLLYITHETACFLFLLSP